MGYRATGRSESTFVAGEVVRSFIPYPLPPSAPPVRVAGPVAERFEAATRALSRLDLAARLTPGIESLAESFLLKEAVLSAQIAGARITLEDALRHRVEGPAGAPDAAERIEPVEHYLHAIEYGRAQLTDPQGLPISTRLLNALHRRLQPAHGLGAGRPGEVRRSPAWQGGVRPGYAELLPPPPRVLPELLTALERYVHADDGLPPLVRAGLIHVQLQTIHPYVDGNGRLSRLLLTLLFQQWGIVAQPLVYLSQFFRQRSAEYHRRVSAVRVDGDWENWLAYFLRGVATVAEDAVSTIAQLSGLVAADRRRAQDAPDASMSSAKLFELLPGHPLVTVASVMELLGVSKPTAGRAVDALQAAGVLVETTGRKRDRAWMYERFVGRLSLGTEL